MSLLAFIALAVLGYHIPIEFHMTDGQTYTTWLALFCVWCLYCAVDSKND